MGLIDVSGKGAVRTVRFNSAKKLNAWSMKMMKEKKKTLTALAQDDSVQAVILTGTGKYYCAGVDLAAVLKPMMPKQLVSTIRSLNEQLFDQFLSFPKPLFVAVNGPTIGAAVTSATLTDGILSNQRATFHTPFASLGLVPEGCSSYMFPKLLGEDLSNKMLNENYKLSAEEAARVGLVDKLVETPEFEEADQVLLDAAYGFAEDYLTKNGVKRSFSAKEMEVLKEVNARESQELAEAFLSEKFFRAMEENAKRKGKTNVKLSFQTLRITRPLWSFLL